MIILKAFKINSLFRYLMLRKTVKKNIDAL